MVTALKIAFYALILGAVIRGSFYLLFALAARPGLWISLMAVFGISNMVLAWTAHWSAWIVGAAAIAGLLIATPDRIRAKDAHERKKLQKAFYEEMNVTRGRLKHLFGLIAFGISSLLTYTLLFGEACSTTSGKCVPLYQVLIH